MNTNNKELSSAIRFLSMDAVQKANSGHPGMPMGMADVATVLFKHFLKYNPKNPNWLNRDRFVLSAGHGSMLLYSLLYLRKCLNKTVATSAIPIGIPGCPELAFCTASMDKNLIALDKSL